MKMLFPILAVLVAVGLFFGFIDPQYQKLKILRAQEARYDQALEKSKELRAIRDRLQETNKAISPADRDRLIKLLPDTVDNVRLAMDLDTMATRYGMRISNVAIVKGVDQTDAIGVSTQAYDSVVVNFAVTSTYANFLKFLADLESSLRLVDIIGVTFSAVKGDLYEFNISARTFWLK